MNGVGPARPRASHRGRSAVSGPTSARRPSTALRRPIPHGALRGRDPAIARLRGTLGRRCRARSRAVADERRWDHEDAGAFVEALFAKHQDEIYAYLLRMLRDPELAADLTQDAFVKAYRAYDSLEKPENARAWLYQIAHRVALDEIRRRKIIRFFPWTGEARGPRRPPSSS